VQIPASTSGVNHILIFTRLFKISSVYVSRRRWLVQNQAKNYGLTVGNNKFVQLRVDSLKNREPNCLRGKLPSQVGRGHTFLSEQQLVIDCQEAYHCKRPNFKGKNYHFTLS
jgi:hypothetical protein